MKIHTCTLLAALAAGTLWFANDAAAQPPTRRPPAGRPGAGQNAAERAAPPLPEDPKLLALHRDFVQRAERLAKEYERANEPAKARAAYEQILRLAPAYRPAEVGLDRVKELEVSANRVVMDVYANRGWQEVGVRLIEGRPVRISARGEWLFRMAHSLSPQGMPIPEDLRDFNLGSLIGIVVDADPKEAKPFYIGQRTEFTAETPGRLFLRMYDSDPSDNSGKLQVEITGTFNENE